MMKYTQIVFPPKKSLKNMKHLMYNKLGNAVKVKTHNQLMKKRLLPQQNFVNLFYCLSMRIIKEKLFEQCKVFSTQNM